MKYYSDLLKLGCFTFYEAMEIIGKERATLSLLQQYTKKGYISKIRKGLYVAIDLSDNQPVANKFAIASKISDTAVISHHSAFEYYGYANQVSYDVNVTSNTKFNSFNFNGVYYSRISPSIQKGIYADANNIRITDIERTVLDSINDFEHYMGFEELIQCISSIPLLNENKLLEYLSEYNKCFLYQKTGYILENLNNDFHFSKNFFNICLTESGNSSRYLLKDIDKNDLAFNKKWKLTVPVNLWDNVLNGGDFNVDI